MKQPIKHKKIFVAAFAVIILSGCATMPTYTPVTSSGKVTLKSLCDKYNANLSWDSLSQVVLIDAQNIHARTMIGSDIVLIGNSRIKLSAPVERENSAIIVPEDFARVVFGPETALNKNYYVPKKDLGIYSVDKIKTVVIDAGHGGKDPGAIGRTGIYEKRIVVDIAKRLKSILKRKGIAVVMTRDDDTFISLNKRTEIASSAKADIFVSIHANANPRRSVYGIEVYTLKNLGYIEKNEDQRQINYRKMYRALKMKSSDKYLQDIVTDMYDSRKQNESDKLAVSIAANMTRTMGARSLGDKKARFYVLRNTLSPAVLVEVGYLSNPREEKRLKTKAYRQKVALGIAKGIMEYAKK